MRLRLSFHEADSKSLDSSSPQHAGMRRSAQHRTTYDDPAQTPTPGNARGKGARAAASFAVSRTCTN